MSTFDNQVEQICEMFGGSFSIAEVTAVFIAKGNDDDVSGVIDTLMTQLEKKKSSNEKNDIHDRHEKQKKNTNKPKHGNTGNNNNKTMRTEKDAFRKYCQEFDNLLPENDLKELWQTVTRDGWQNKLDLKAKYEIAKEYALQRIQWILDKPPILLTEDNSLNYKDDPLLLPNPEHDFQQFSQLFQGVLPFSLETIWTNLDESLSTYEKQQIGILYALDLLEQDQMTNNSTSFPINEKKLKECIQQQERTRIQSISTQRNMKITIKHGKNSQNPRLCSPQEMVKNMIIDLFRDSTISSEMIDELLILHDYDIESIVEDICNQLLQQGNFIRGEISYANIVQNIKTPTETFSSNYPENDQKIVFGGSSNIKGSYANIVAINPAVAANEFTVVSGNGSMKKTANRQQKSNEGEYTPKRTLTSKQQQNRIRFGEHFYNVFIHNNPQIKLTLDPLSGELIYDGSLHFQSIAQNSTLVPMTTSSRSPMRDNNNNTRRDDAMHMISIAIDLHNIPVLQTLQIVTSSIEYYRIQQRAYILGNTNIKRILLKFIVGKGIHSPGGVAKLGPAIEKLLRQREERDVVVYEGEIMLALHLLRK